MLLSLSKKQIRSFQLLAIFILTMTCWSCKKETPDLPYKDIESFSIRDASGNTLSASIVEDRIILYWPPLVDQPESITPTIKVSEMATITPASGTSIELQLEKPIIYTVRAQDGSSKNYTLSFQVNQPQVQAKLNDPINTYYLNEPEKGTFTFVGENIIPNETQTKGYLIDKDGKETLLSLNTALTYFIAKFTAPDNLKAGSSYQVKLVSGRFSVLSDPFEVLLPGLSALIKSNVAYNATKGQNLVVPLVSKILYELYFKSDFDHFVAVDNLNNSYKITNAIVDVTNLTVSLPIPTTVLGNKITVLKIMDKSGKILTESNYSIAVN
ncbi:hypothetical protein [Sphingobacterium anhuiense]|uniref:DUF5018 domain-containing protein n=1 Tax=Sphingobacterium anhuiense TaxID=493780 RepID=A0ABW5Z1J9_9SPHI